MNDVKVYRTQHCPYCDMAERLLDELDVDYEEVDVTRDSDLRDELARRTGMETVPQIFIDGEAIGGFDELRELQESGELAARLEEE